MKTILNNSVSLFLGIVFCFTMSICESATEQSNLDAIIQLSDDVIVEQISSNIWLHTTFLEFNRLGKVGANGLIITAGNDAVMIDLPWTDQQTALLFDWVKTKLKADIRTVVPTHFHDDCAGGLAEAHRRGAHSVALNKTVALLRENNKPVPESGFENNYVLKRGDRTLELFYIGGGHTIDNIVAWIGDSKVLFAGCLLKGLDFKSIGNTGDADLNRYPDTLQKLKKQFKDAIIVVPGHGKPGGLELIDHTAAMLNKYLAQKNQ